MPSFKIYVIREDYHLSDVVKKDLLKTKARDDDPDTFNTLLQDLETNHKNLTLSEIRKDEILKMNVIQKISFENDQTVWVGVEKHLIRYGKILLIGKTADKLEKLVWASLRDEANIAEFIFKDKQLWGIWKELRKLATDGGFGCKLHRIILHGTEQNPVAFFDDSVIELNIQSKNLADIRKLDELVSGCEKVQAITIKVNGIGKDLTDTVRFKHLGCYHPMNCIAHCE
jgi:hypothetical protein